MKFLKSMAFGLAAAVMGLSGSVAQAQTVQMVAPNHVKYMVVKMSNIIQQPNVVMLMDKDGATVRAAVTQCNVEWKGGEEFYFLQAGVSFYLIKKRDLDTVYAQYNNWDNSIALLMSIGRVCRANQAG